MERLNASIRSGCSRTKATWTIIVNSRPTASGEMMDTSPTITLSSLIPARSSRHGHLLARGNHAAVTRKIHPSQLFSFPEPPLFVKAYPAETAEAFCEGHVSAFAFFGGIPVSILYDNTRLAVAKILGDGTRKRSTLFAALQSHYVFEDRYGRPGKGNDKGKVEGMVGFARRTFMVPFPREMVRFV